MLDTGSNARTTAILGLPIGWLWVFFFKKITAISSKWEKRVIYFLLHSVLVLLLKTLTSPLLPKYNHNH